jgi:hypothetical protein
MEIWNNLFTTVCQRKVVEARNFFCRSRFPLSTFVTLNVFVSIIGRRSSPSHCTTSKTKASMISVFIQRTKRKKHQQGKSGKLSCSFRHPLINHLKVFLLLIQTTTFLGCDDQDLREKDLNKPAQIMSRLVVFGVLSYKSAFSRVYPPTA